MYLQQILSIIRMFIRHATTLLQCTARTAFSRRRRAITLRS